MLIIQRRGSCRGGMGRYYHGSGMFGEIGRKLFSSGIKKIISSGTSSSIAHKVADAVVNGATSTSKSCRRYRERAYIYICECCKNSY